jgi:hypothetical protein
MSIFEATNTATSWSDYVRAVEREKRDISSQPRGEPVFRVACREVRGKSDCNMSLPLTYFALFLLEKAARARFQPSDLTIHGSATRR